MASKGGGVYELSNFDERNTLIGNLRVMLRSIAQALCDLDAAYLIVTNSDVWGNHKVRL